MTDRFLALPEVVGNRRVAWLERKMRDWMAARIAERDRVQK